MQLNRTLPPALVALTISTRSWPTYAVMIGADLLAIVLASIISVYTRLALEGQFAPSLYWQLWPVLGLFIAAYAIVGLYPGVAISPVDEMRWLCLATTLMYLALAAMVFMQREGEIYSRGVFVMAWALSLLLVIVCRAVARLLFARKRWWGYPTMVLGAGKTGSMVIRTLKRRPGIGLKPVLVLDDDPKKHGSLHGVPVVGGVELAPALARTRKIPYAIVAMPGVPRDRLLSLLERYGSSFAHLLVIPDLFEFSSLWVEAKDMGGVLGLEVRQRLLLPGPRLTKFLIDLAATLIGGLLVLPLFLLIALLIKLDSPGPIFYSQIRIGQGGQPFKAWKFRTMVQNADYALKTYFEQHPELREAWERDQKLRYDPRVTRIGRFLRRTSLDELPQLWNILRGEMSLVGPRPIIDEEIPRYGDKFPLYTKVIPGLTGLWQVSGRNNITYEERVSLDAYYVRNWSVWLDVYILLRTVWVVLSGEGAY
ncbi:MAG: undecaprenyl-phosphate galactose phosphotransferase WbaP [Leptolyngbya sp. IPPAS B-1204]|uniref:Undecaprenyl-phosphate galactose phosphotransferase WbaP n=1 Tax=Leptolyngbya sp. NK1-12 TaxID=2547451 RepID=A0AA96WGQ7_9CYAN|nr:undecaprenyl-phosphate galactose phosphotransferase WbaP [Leptolyngbya sp. NK1-12]MBF2049921.1 undecaprenyl-phosphate galactose phosphotransferase WbaP [Elainella sp. C42_A2020_010]RNJ68060.1 MAG: undecaprenyl-phosphate galactose phosphotransferase WbaP [Leptolyngbya sp. IPPAS B-1204]WNZ22026.1 undecaprenyl-phosphate galactose phosphotransferase WbaP [Leptolyngbya sp. NK1-12]